MGFSRKGKMRADQKRWDERYKGSGARASRSPNAFLKKYIRLLPQGTALDVACGEGANAVFLARKRFKVEALDISGEALRKARKLAGESKVKIRTLRADLDFYPLAKGKYDLIANFYFLDRRLIPKLKRALKKEGRIIFETYLADPEGANLDTPQNPRYLLKPNELLRRFRDFRILIYREGIFREGGRKKAIASLIAEKT